VSTLAVIPARFASTRFPGKPLALLHGKPMVQHVWERCCDAKGVNAVIVATEDERVLRACEAFSARCELTSAEHASGTDRVAEIARRHPEFSAILNVQGDEPGMDPQTISQVAAALSDPAIEIATAVVPSTDCSALENPNIVKAVLAETGRALYFSRARIPFIRDVSAVGIPTYFRHLGIYGFQRDVLARVTTLAVSPLERAESLEQLRWLQAGISIHCVPVTVFSAGVDTPADLESLAKSLQA
jgi:3-deoxy-manno-octulosonate cytidylyltransferase (CMP-KDO synthetase)